MPATETLAHSEGLAELDAEAEHALEVSQETASTLGHIALLGDESIDSTYISEGIEDVEAFLGRSAEEGTRIQDVEAAHEAAIAENEIFDAHVAALQENEIFDAHVAALQEDAEREQAKATLAASQESPHDNIGETNKEEAIPDQTPAQSIREEASTALKEAGADTKLAASGEVTKDAMGNLLIINGNDAKLVTRSIDGSSKVVDYEYDEKENTITINNAPFHAYTSGNAEYQQTELKNWQTNTEVITLPLAIAKRFGIERVVAVK